jgi:hypothetical protein
VCLAAFAPIWALAQEEKTPPATPAPVAQQQAPAQPQAATSSDSGSEGASIGLFYWYNRAPLHLRNGKAAVVGDNPADLDFPSKNQASPGAIITLPAGKYNTLQISYFRARGAGSGPTPKAVKIYDQSYSAGDVLNTKYNLQSVKVSWDYLTFPVPPSENALRIKTLWQVQYVNLKTELDAPALDSDTTSTYVTKSHWFVYPSIGAGLEKRFSRKFRWELKGSGFWLPHRAAIWDAESFLAVRASHVEMKFGGRAFYFKTSPKKSEYLYDTLPGAFVELSWHTN